MTPSSDRRATFVSQHVTATHGQGRINLEAIRHLSRCGWRLNIVAAEVETDLLDLNSINFFPVAVPGKLPTNWARETVFRKLAGRRVAMLRSESQLGLLITNGAALDEAGDINLCMFVHTAWLDSPWHPRQAGGGLHGRYLALYNAFNARLEKPIFNRAGHVVALAPVIRDELTAYHLSDEAKISVIPPGVEPEVFRPLRPGESNRLRDACNLADQADQETMLVVFVGEIRSNRKNLDLVLRGLAATPRTHLSVLGSTVGSPYPAMAEQLGIADRVHWLGHRSDVAELLRGADVMAFPTHYEPYGLVVTEAMASGLPVIVTPQCGAAMRVTSQCGVILDSGNDLEGITRTLQGWRDAPLRRRSAGEAALSQAALWTWQHMGEAYEQLFIEMLEESTSAAGPAVLADVTI